MSPSESIGSLEFDSQRQQQAIALVGRVEALENRIHSSFSADEHKQYFLTNGSRRINGQVIIDYTGTEALLVRKNNDGGDVFTVNTSTAGVSLAGTLGVTGNTTITGTVGITGDTTIDGKQIIDVTDTEALLVRKNADGGDVFVVDTTNNNIELPTGSAYLANTTTSTTGIIYKGSAYFIHDFLHPTGDTAVPSGLNLFIGSESGNFTMGSTATEVYHGSRNIGFGLRTLYALTTGYFNMAMGTSACGNVTSGGGNAGIGYTALLNITTGDANVAIGYTAGRYTNAGGNLILNSSSIFIGYDTRGSANANTNEIVIGYAARGQGTNTIMLGNSAVTSLLCYDTTITSPSDKRIKKNIVSLDQSVMLDFITELNPITYNKINPKDWDKKFKAKKPKKKDDEPDLLELEQADNLNTYAGLIAQDVAIAMKKHGVDYELVDELNDGMLSLRYGDLIPALIGAVKELARKVDLQS